MRGLYAVTAETSDTEELRRRVSDAIVGGARLIQYRNKTAPPALRQEQAGALAKLTQKVKAGGVGVWGPVPMPPNSWVADGDIQALVTWILALKK